MSDREMTVSEYRLSIGVDIIKELISDDVFPISCKDELTEIMMEYFYNNGYEDQLYDIGSSWLPNKEYWSHRMGAIQDELRKDKIYLEGRIFVGDWRICDKKEYDIRMKVKAADCNHRVESYNEKITDANKRWPTFNHPYGNPIPLLYN